MNTVRTRIESAYPIMTKWVEKRYGKQDGLDYLHDAAIVLMEHRCYAKLSEKELTGAWRILVHRVYLNTRLDEVETVPLNDNIVTHDNKQAAKRYAKHLMMFLPSKGRKVLTKLYILGETREQVADSLSLSQDAIRKVRKESLEYLAELVQLDAQ